MNAERFGAVEAYIEGLFVDADPVLAETLRAAAEAGLPEIQISAGQGKLLYLLAKLCGARRILELGTLGGYSSIWLARALPVDGRLVTLEFSPKHAEVARANIEHAGLGEQVEIVVGAALDGLAQLEARGEQPFDMVFIDADKPNYSNYLAWSLRLTRPGSLIIADNVVRAGAVLDPEDDDSAAVAAQAFNAALAAEARVEAIVVQQVGPKGHDGMAIARVR